MQSALLQKLQECVCDNSFRKRKNEIILLVSEGKKMLMKNKDNFTAFIQKYNTEVP